MTNSIKKTFAVCTAICMAMVQGARFPMRTEAADRDFSAFGAVGVFSESETEKIADAIYSGLESHEKVIDLSGWGMPTICNNDEYETSLHWIYSSVITSTDVGLLTNRFEMFTSDNETDIINIKPTYLVDEASYEREFDAAIALLDDAVSGVNSRWSEAEKALYLHNWIIDRYMYEEDYVYVEGDYSSNTAYNMLKRGMAVCDGYAWLYNVLLSRVGVDSLIVTSAAQKHAWNLLEIDGSWYHVDVAWDDFGEAIPGHAKYNSFLKSNDCMRYSGHVYNDWTLSTGRSVYEMPVSSKYDYGFWNGTYATVRPLEDGTWLAVGLGNNPNTAEYMKYTFNAETGRVDCTVLHTYTGNWMGMGRSYTAADFYNGVMCFTSENAVYTWYNGQVNWLFNLTEEQKADNHEIYGMYIEDGIMHYFTCSSEMYEIREYKIDLAYYPYIFNVAPAETTTAETTTTPETTTTTTETTTTPETTTTTTTTETTTTTTTTETTTTTTTTETTTTTTTTETTTTTTTTETTTTTTTIETTTTTTTTETTTTTTTTTTAATTTAIEIFSTAIMPYETVMPTTEPPGPPVWGDLNDDGDLSIVDVIALQRYLVQDTMEAETAEYADLTSDGRVNAFDLAVLKKILLTKKN